jgi:hypothetical protein
MATTHLARTTYVPKYLETEVPKLVCIEKHETDDIK